MSDLITDEMVEEALEVSYDPPKEPGRTFLNRDYYCRLWSPYMRAALEAVAPLIAAKALREASEDMWDCKKPGHWNLRDPHDPETSYSPDAWLEKRADRLEAGQS